MNAGFLVPAFIFIVAGGMAGWHFGPPWCWRLHSSITTQRKRCLHHREITPVASLAGEVVAWLCRTCDAQLPADYDPGDPGRIEIGRVWR